MSEMAACPYCHRLGCEGTGILDPATRAVPARFWIDTEHKSKTTMGPIVIDVDSGTDEAGVPAWSYLVELRLGRQMRTITNDGWYVTRDEAKAAAVTAVEAWRDSIR